MGLKVSLFLSALSQRAAAVSCLERSLPLWDDRLEKADGRDRPGIDASYLGKMS